MSDGRWFQYIFHMLSAKPWRADAVIRFCTAQFACLCLGMMAIGLLQKIGVSGFKSPGDSGNVLLSTLCFQGATWMLIPIFLRQHRIGWREAFGLRGPELNRSLLLAVVFVIAILPVAWLLQNLSISALTRLGWPPADQTAVALMASAKSPWLEIYLGAFAVVLAPVAEEFIFRGMLFPVVRQLGYPRLAWFGVSALFAFIHFDLAIFLPLFTLALALTWLYEKTGNLLAPVAAHSLFNTANLIVLHFEDQLNRLLQYICHFLHLA
jgi:membrane protease YdiL (CAAX protease family)